MNAESPHIKKVEEADIPRCVEIAREAYPDRDTALSLPWFTWCVKSPRHLVLIGSGTVGVASLNVHYGTELRPRLDLLYSIPVRRHGLEALTMVRIMLRWSKQQGAKPPFFLGSEGGFDFGPFAKRLGGWQNQNPSYEIPF